MQLSKRMKSMSKRSIRITLAIATCALVVAVFTGWTMMVNTITIHDGDVVYAIQTTQTDPAEIVADEAIVLGARDHYELSAIQDNQADLYIIRPFDITVSDALVVTELVVTGGTVQDALDMMEITLDERDYLNCELTDTLTSDMNIVVTRCAVEEFEEESVIAFDLDKPEDELDAGDYLEVDVTGQDGVLSTTYQTMYVNGKKLGTIAIEETVLVEPVTQTYTIIESPVDLPSSIVDDPSFTMGRDETSDEYTTEVYKGGVAYTYEEGEAPIELDEDGVPLDYIYMVEGKATAYSNFGNPTLLAPGCVAVNQDIFPFGTMLYIRTADNSYIYGYSKVADTGTAVNEGTVLVDVFFDTYLESCLFGLKDVEVYVISYVE